MTKIWTELLSADDGVGLRKMLLKRYVKNLGVTGDPVRTNVDLVHKPNGLLDRVRSHLLNNKPRVAHLTHVVHGEVGEDGHRVVGAVVQERKGDIEVVLSGINAGVLRLKREGVIPIPVDTEVGAGGLGVVGAVVPERKLDTEVVHTRINAVVLRLKRFIVIDKIVNGNIDAGLRVAEVVVQDREINI